MLAPEPPQPCSVYLCKSIVLEVFTSVSCHPFSRCFQKMAKWHMRGLTPIVTLLWASGSQRAESENPYVLCCQPET